MSHDFWRQTFAHAFISYLPLKSFILQSKRTLTIKQILIFLEAVVHRCSSKWVFLKTCNFNTNGWFLKTCNFIKKRLQHRCFYVKFAKFLGISLFTEHLPWLLLSFLKQKRKNEKICSQKYIHRQTPVMVSFLVQLQDWGLTFYEKGTPY